MFHNKINVKINGARNYVNKIDQNTFKAQRNNNIQFNLENSSVGASATAIHLTFLH